MGKITRKSLVSKLLYKVFRDNVDKILTKEFLIQTVWNQNYNPLVHDNLLYTHLCRLRKMLHPAEAIKSCYNGYKYVTDKGVVVAIQRILDDFKAITDEEKQAAEHLKKAIELLNSIEIQEPEFKSCSITPEILWEMKQQKLNGETLKSIAQKYNVSRATVHKVFSGKLKYLGGEHVIKR